MSYIEQDHDVDNFLEAETQIGAIISSHERKQGEKAKHDQPNRDVFDIHMNDAWEYFGILAMRRKVRHGIRMNFR